ncbi:MAG TPA: ATP-binding protein [Candidatus Saccharimonadales bacterium]|nr:ATP-binding protein [Candidatus Saccharimonadales bacterium]
MRYHNRFAAPVLCGLALLFCAVLWPARAAAGVYGRDSFGSCAYAGCAPVAPPVSTQTTLPSGLEISVNLVSGQVVPRSGYTIVVTPVNGRGSSFRSVDFYIDGVLVQAGVLPGETGTASWHWDPAAFPGSVVRVVVTDVDGRITAQEFTVHVEDAPAPVLVQRAAGRPASPRVADGGAATGLAGVLQRAAASAERAIRALPRPVVYAFPYALLALLAGNAVVLLLQAKRELSEYATIKKLLARNRAMEEGKKTFLALVSHYLRTPLTVMGGGIELAAGHGGAVATLAAVQKRLGGKIEALIARVDAGTQEQAPPPGLAARLPVWRPGLLVPLCAGGALVFGFTALTVRAGSFTVSHGNVATQAVVFCLVASATYYLFRQAQLHRRDSRLLQAVLEREAAAMQARDDLIIRAGEALQGDVDGLDAPLARLGAGRAAGFIRTGQAQLRGLLGKFLLVARLRGGHSQAPPRMVRLPDMFGAISQDLQEKAAGKRVTITPAMPPAAQRLGVREPELLQYVLHSLADNAVAYSNDGGRVQLAAASSQGGTLFSVTDSGTPIPAQKLPALFQPFSKAEGAEVFTHEGAGLSLYIAKLAMDYMGGRIWAESDPDKTVVWVWAPEG